MTHRQVCFTRLSGQGVNDGWQAVNFSRDLPREVVAAFTRFQNGNITPPVFDKEDADSRIVTELQNDGENVFYSLIKYNTAADDRGRSIMFAHSFVFDLNEFVCAPQDVLCVDGGNFGFNMEDTKDIPDVLTRAEQTTLGECAKFLGLTEESYSELVRCVYYILDGKTKKTLHIICDCAPDTVRKYMICIYNALPFEFRKKITFATYESQNGAAKTIIFDRKVRNGSYYIDLQSGENNILTEPVRRKYAKYEFMYIAPKGYLSEDNFDGFYKKLEEKLSLFAAEKTTSLELYKIAYDLILDDENYVELSPEMIVRRLNELLSAPVSHPFLDRQIQLVLGDIISRDIELNDVLAEKLGKKSESTRDKELMECCYLYNARQITRKGVEEGAKYLYDTYSDRNTEAFLQMKKTLNKDEKGKRIFNHLYNVIVAADMPADKEHITAFFEETKRLSDRGEIRETLYRKLCEYARKIVAEEKNPRRIMDAIIEMCPVLRDKPLLAKELREYTKRFYWKSFRFEDIEFESPAAYDCVCLSDDEKCMFVYRLLNIYKMFAENNNLGFVREIKEVFFGGEAAVSVSDSDRAVIKEKLLDTCVKNNRLISENELDIWISLGSLLSENNKNFVKFLIENRIPSVCGNFEEAFLKSKVLKNEAQREKFVSCLKEFEQEKTKDSAIAADALRVIRENEKRTRQESKKQERETRDSGDKKSLLSGIGGKLFKKKSGDDGNLQKM